MGRKNHQYFCYLNGQKYEETKGQTLRFLAHIDCGSIDTRLGVDNKK